TFSSSTISGPIFRSGATAKAEDAMRTLSSMPTNKVKWNPRNSMMASGRIAPRIAPSKFETYRKLNERRDSNRGSLRTANIPRGMVAPMKAHHGTKVTAMHTPEINEYVIDENSVELARWE